MAKVYHREDLRRELVDAAYAYVCDHGHDDLSIRKLSQIVEVSSAAPYHHFSDRRAVLVAVAERGFQMLRLSISDGAKSCQQPRDRLAAAARSFFDFPLRFAKLFELMYDSELTKPSVDPEVEVQYQQIYLPIVADFCALTGSDDEAAVRVQIYWATIFGFAFLSARGMRGRLGQPRFDMESLQERVIAAAIGD